MIVASDWPCSGVERITKRRVECEVTRCKCFPSGLLKTATVFLSYSAFRYMTRSHGGWRAVISLTRVLGDRIQTR